MGEPAGTVTHAVVAHQCSHTQSTHAWTQMWMLLYSCWLEGCLHPVKGSMQWWLRQAAGRQHWLQHQQCPSTSSSFPSVEAVSLLGHNDNVSSSVSSSATFIIFIITIIIKSAATVSPV